MNVEYKYRLGLLLTGIGVIFFMVYTRLIKSTVTQAFYIYNTSNSVNIDGLNNQLSESKVELMNYSNSMNLGRSETEIQHFMIDFVSSRGNSVLLNRVLEPHYYQIDQYNVINQRFEIKGRFKPTVELIYELETSKDPVYVTALKIVSRKNQTTNKYELFTVIYVQSVKNI